MKEGMLLPQHSSFLLFTFKYFFKKILAKTQGVLFQSLALPLPLSLKNFPKDWQTYWSGSQLGDNGLPPEGKIYSSPRECLQKRLEDSVNSGVNNCHNNT